MRHNDPTARTARRRRRHVRQRGLPVHLMALDDARGAGTTPDRAPDRGPAPEPERVPAWKRVWRWLPAGGT